MPTHVTPPTPTQPSPIKIIVLALSGTIVILFAIWGGLQASAAGGEALSEWQKFIIAFIGSIGALITVTTAKQTYDAKKSNTAQKDNNEKLTYLTDIFEQQGIRIDKLTKQNALLSGEIRDLKYKIETLSRENESLTKLINRYEANK